MRLFVSIGFVLMLSVLHSQRTLLGFTPHYSYQISAGDLGDKYTNNSNIGANIFLKLKSNWTFGIEGQFLFGSNYRDLSFLGSMVTDGGFILDKNLGTSIPDIQGRGSNFFVEAGKILPLDKTIPDCGLHLKLGLGMMSYKALINVDDIDVTQLAGSYVYGYNRAEEGLSINTYLGYTFYSTNKFVNGSFGIQMIYFSSSYVNKLNYVNGNSLEGQRFSSVLIGPKASIILVLKTFSNNSVPKDGYYFN